MASFFLRLLVFLAAFGPLASHARATVAVVLSERAPAYEQVASALREELPPAAEVLESLPREIESLREARPRLIVAVGTSACREVAESRLTFPLLCVLLPRSAYERIASQAAKGAVISALWLDQPESRQLRLIRLAMPNRRHVGVLLGEESAALDRTFAAAASEHGLSMTTSRVESGERLYDALQVVLDRADVLLAVPDSGVFNSRTLQNILRAALQNNVPLVAFSPAYVRAGAVLGLYTTPTQIGRQAGRWAAGVLAGQALPAPASPREFEIAVNSNVARSLGIAVGNERRLAERLRRTEQSR